MTQPTPNYLQRILETGSCLERCRAYYAAVFHDDWCASNLTKNCQDCNCKPIVRVHSTPLGSILSHESAFLMTMATPPKAAYAAFPNNSGHFISIVFDGKTG